MKSLLNALGMIVLFTAISLSFCNENDIFELTSTQLEQIGRLDPQKLPSGFLKRKKRHAENNWCCANGAPAFSQLCPDRWVRCCADFMLIAQDCIRVSAVTPEFVDILKELIGIGAVVVDKVGVTEKPFKTTSRYQYSTTGSPYQTTDDHHTWIPYSTTRDHPETTDDQTWGSYETTDDYQTYTTASQTRSSELSTTEIPAYGSSDTQLLSLSTPPTPVSIFSCNFDIDNCMPFYYNLYSPANDYSFISLTNASLWWFENVSVTDMTSITKPTGETPSGPFDRPTCQIPWQQDSTTYNFCNDEFKCKNSGQNELSFCQRGKFLVAQTGVNGFPFRILIYYNSISLNFRNVHEVSFWALMHCHGKECVNFNDRIVLEVRDDSGSYREEVISYNDLDKPLAWQRFSFRFCSRYNYVDLRIGILRDKTVDSIAYFALDNISINQVG